MDKYQKIMKPRESAVKDEKEIRCTAVGSVSAYVSRAAKVLNEMKEPYITITGTGNAIAKAVQLAEVVKRRVKGLHQITSLGSIDIVDEYEPLEEGLDKVSDSRTMSTIEIKLSTEALDTSDKGYQAPLDESEVKEFDEEDLTKSRGRGRGKGGKGRGKSGGKGKGKGKGKDDKGKGKGKGKDSKGKGKGKDDKGKGKGKDSKGNGKGKDKGKGKDSGKSKAKGSKGKSKGGYSSGYDSYSSSWGGGYSGGGKSGGYDSSWGGGYSSYPPMRNKGKGKGGGGGWDSYGSSNRSWGGGNSWY